MKLYRVKAWNTHYENNKSREREKCSYVCVPNSQHGLGFIRVMAHKNGASIYGIWCLLLGALSRQGKHRDGWLTDDGHQTGTAWAPSDLAILWRREEAEIEEALNILSSKQVGWIEIVDVLQVSGSEVVVPLNIKGARRVPVECPIGALEEKRSEENRNELSPLPPRGIEREESVAPAGKRNMEKDFDEFWAAYPEHRKTNQYRAQSAWSEVRHLLPTNPELIHALEAFKNSHEWKKENGKMVPGPHTWLLEKRWGDAPAYKKPAGPVLTSAPFIPVVDEDHAIAWFRDEYEGGEIEGIPISEYNQPLRMWHNTAQKAYLDHLKNLQLQ